jgi:hypothetical protein
MRGVSIASPLLPSDRRTKRRPPFPVWIVSTMKPFRPASLRIGRGAGVSGWLVEIKLTATQSLLIEDGGARALSRKRLDWSAEF